MKKYFVSLMAMMMAVVMCMTFSSCSKDDDETDGSGGFSIVGTWYEYEDDVESLDAVWVFNSDNTGSVEEYYHGKSEGVDKIKYKFANNTLSIYYEGEEDDPSVFKINIVSNDEFTWSDGHDKLTFKRKK